MKEKNYLSLVLILFIHSFVRSFVHSFIHFQRNRVMRLLIQRYFQEKAERNEIPSSELFEAVEQPNTRKTVSL